MKNIGKLAVLGAVLSASSSFALADTITLGSFGSTTGFNPGAITVSNTAMNFVGDVISLTTPPPAVPPLGVFSSVNTMAFDLNPGTPVWAPALPNSAWVGYTATAGPVGTINPSYGYYEFTTQFNLAGTYSGTLNVMADDTTEVLLTNGGGTTTLIAFGALLSDSHCAGGTPNCLVAGSASLSGLTGLQTLTFVVEQAGTGAGPNDFGLGGSNPSGFDFNATLTSPSTISPEPSSLVLLSTGLLGAAGMLFRRRTTT